MSESLPVELSRDEIQDLLEPHVTLEVLSHRQAVVRRSAYRKLRSALEQEPHRVLADSFEDERGKIQDLIDGPIDSVTRITTLKDAIRGNHFHERTIQWTYVLTGCLRILAGKTELLLGAGEIVVYRPGEPHAWKAVEDTDCLVFTRGPRSGDRYESDTFKLSEPLVT